MLNKVDINAKRLKRVSSFKVYLSNPSLRSALFSPITESDAEMGPMVETAVLSQWMHREKLDLAYARWKEGRREGEVDLVLVDSKRYSPVWGVEVKWSNRFLDNPQELKSLIQFCEANQLHSALVTTAEVSGEKIIKTTAVTFIPAALYCYNVGDVTLRIKSFDNIQSHLGD